MKTEQARPGTWGVDSLPFSEGGTAAQAQALANEGCSFVYGYLGVITRERVKFVLDTGMAYMSVTLAGHYDGPTAVSQSKALGASSQLSTCLDIEGLKAFNTDPILLATTINAWADAVDGADLHSCGYFGSPQPFNSTQMWKLHLKGYWRGQGRIVDHQNALAEPWNCGWSAIQVYPSVHRGCRTFHPHDPDNHVGCLLVDVDFITRDYLGRVPNWGIAG